MLVNRFEVRRVHGWKTYRVFDHSRKDWEGPPMAMESEAKEHAEYMTKYSRSNGRPIFVEIKRLH